MTHDHVYTNEKVELRTDTLYYSSICFQDVNTPVIGIAIGVTGAIILIVVVVMVTRCYYNHKTKDTKIQDSNPNLNSITENNKAKHAWSDIRMASGKPDFVSKSKFKCHPKSVFAQNTLSLEDF